MISITKKLMLTLALITMTSLNARKPLIETTFFNTELECEVVEAIYRKAKEDKFTIILLLQNNLDQQSTKNFKRMFENISLRVTSVNLHEPIVLFYNTSTKLRPPLVFSSCKINYQIISSPYLIKSLCFGNGHPDILIFKKGKLIGNIIGDFISSNNFTQYEKEDEVIEVIEELLQKNNKLTHDDFADQIPTVFVEPWH